MLVAAIDIESRHNLRVRGGHMHDVCMQRWLAKAKPPAGANSHGLATCKGRPTMARPPARGCRPRPALPPAGAAMSVAGVAAPWQGSCRPQRVAVACVGAAAAAAYLRFFLVYCWACVPVSICNYMERCNGSMEVTSGPIYRGGRSRRMVMRRSNRTDEDEINNHKAWIYANAHIDPIVSD
ncbi:hypothetical protein BHM03_00061197 [Ensete ventricosum]|nr:hypothetical protein BHM03_00061197 [Ensete ventricosum]